jgi:flagellar motor switch protein FliG
MQLETTELTGLRKAAIFLMAVGKERAGAVLRELREDEVGEVVAEIARLQHVEAEDVDRVLGEFQLLAEAHRHMATGGIEYARELLEAGLGAEKAFEIMERLTPAIMKAPFQFLRQTDPKQVLSFISEEHPQTIALVLAHMHPDHGAMILASLTEELQRDVARRIAVMDRTTPEVIQRVETVLQKKLSSVIVSGESSNAGGVQSLVDLLNRSDRATERLILEGLEDSDVELADEVRQLMFVFEDIVQLDDRSVQLVLRQVDAKDLAVALKGVRADVRDKILKNMSERAAQNLVEEIELMGPVRIKTVEESQGAVVRVIRALEEAGQIVLTRGGADEFVV